MAEYYFIAAGGTGIRVVIALLHSCACGALAGDKLHVLVLDSDEDRNAFVLKEQVRRYGRLRELFQDSHNPDAPNGTLFSAQVDVEVVDKAIRQIGDFSLDDSTTIQMAWDVSSSPQYAGEDKLFLKALLGNEQVNNTKPSNGLYGCPALGALLLKPVIEKDPVMTAGVITDGKIMHFLNRYDPDMPLAFCASSFGGTGVASILGIWNALGDMNKLPTGEKKAILCLAPYFKVRNNNIDSWDREGVQKKHTQAKEFFEKYYQGFHRIVEPAQNPLWERGEYIEEKQKNWPDLTEWHAAWILGRFFQPDASWRTIKPSDADRDLLERFARLSWVWNEEFEESVRRGKPKLLRSNALWTQTIPQRRRHMADEPNLLENVMLREFMMEWQAWYLKMHTQSFGPVLLDPSLNEDEKCQAEREKEKETLKSEKEDLRKKCDSDKGYADLCWELASATSYGSKAKLLQTLYDLSKGDN